MKKYLLLVFALISIFGFSQVSKTYTSGIVYWGVFDAEKKYIVGKLEKESEILTLKKIDFDYFVYSIDAKGSKSRSKYTRINNEYFDEFGEKYLIEEKDNSIFLLCLKELPNYTNKFMILKITDLK